MYYYYQETIKPQKQFIAETEEDIAKLPTTAAEGDAAAAIGDAYRRDLTFGSTARCVETGENYMLTSDNQWTRIGSGGSSGGGADLPPVDAADNGKLLGVDDGEWAVVNPPTELPAVTSHDDGNLLGVSSGVWTKVAPPINYVDATVTYDNNVYSIDIGTATFANIAAAATFGKIVVLRATLPGAGGILAIPLNHISASAATFTTVDYQGTTLYCYSVSVTANGATFEQKAVTLSA